MSNAHISDDSRFRPPGEQGAKPAATPSKHSFERLTLPDAEKAAFNLEPDRSLLRDIWSKIRSVEWAKIAMWPVATFQSERALDNIQRISTAIRNPAPVLGWENLLDKVDERVGAPIRSNLHEIGAVVGTSYVKHMGDAISRFTEVEQAVEDVAGMPLRDLTPNALRTLTVRQRYEIAKIYKNSSSIVSELVSAHEQAGTEIAAISSSVAGLINSDLEIRENHLASLPRSIKALYNRMRHGIFDTLAASGGIESADSRGTIDSISRAHAELENSMDTIKAVSHALSDVQNVLDKNAKIRAMLEQGVPEKIEEEQVAVVSPALLEKVSGWFEQASSTMEGSIDPSLKAVKTSEDCDTWIVNATHFVRDSSSYHHTIEAIGRIFLPFTKHTENEKADPTFRETVTKMRETIEKEVESLLDGSKSSVEVLIALQEVKAKSEKLALRADELFQAHELSATNTKATDLLEHLGIPYSIRHDGITEASHPFRQKISSWLNEGTRALGTETLASFNPEASDDEFAQWQTKADEFKRHATAKHAMVQAMAEAIEPLSVFLLTNDPAADPLLTKGVGILRQRVEREILSELSKGSSPEEFMKKMASLRQIADDKAKGAAEFRNSGEKLSEAGLKVSLADLRKRIEAISPVKSF